MNRKNILLGLVLAAALLFSGSVKAYAVDIRFFVNQSGGLYEVLTGSNAGGRFIYRPTNEYVFGKRVVGYTDRASRGESVVTQVNGSGIASSAGVEINNVVRGRWNNVPLPFTFPSQVSVNPNDDNITAFVTQNNVTTRRRLPVGTR